MKKRLVTLATAMLVATASPLLKLFRTGIAGRIKAAITLTALLVSTTGALADWQYTRWGMTREQVLMASRGQLKQCDDANCEEHSGKTDVARLFGDYSSGDLDFTQYALFDRGTDKLSSITLILKRPDDRHRLIGSIRAKYGEPTKESKGDPILSFYLWRTESDQIAIFVVEIGPQTVALTYSPRITASNKGL